MVKNLARITHGGSLHHGEAIAFTFQYEDQSTEQFTCDMSALGKVLGNLRAFAQIAENERLGRPMGTDPNVIIHPYVSKELPRTGVGTDGSIGLEFSTTEGFPVTIVMPREQARGFVDKLERELGNPIPKPFGQN